MHCSLCDPSPPTVPQPPQVFSVRGFEALFPCTGTLGCTVCLAPSCSSQFINMQIWDCLLLQSLPSRTSSPPQLPFSAPPISLDECFLFNSLVFRLPYCLIFWQVWLFFVFKFVVILLLFVGGSKAYLTMPPSWQEVLINNSLSVTQMFPPWNTMAEILFPFNKG